jgi:hypothetical protein
VNVASATIGKGLQQAADWLTTAGCPAVAATSPGRHELRVGGDQSNHEGELVATVTQSNLISVVKTRRSAAGTTEVNNGSPREPVAFGDLPWNDEVATFCEWVFEPDLD